MRSSSATAREIWHQTHLLALFAALSIGLAVTAVWGRMTFQRSWRAWVSRHLIAAWLGDERYRRIDLWNGEHQNAEYRIAEDARLATDAPIDLVVGLLASVLTAGTFVVVLWHVGGALDVALLGVALTIPGYLVVAAVAYAILTTGTLMFVGRRMIGVIESKNQAESELKYVFAHLRERAGARMSAADDADVDGGGSRLGAGATSCANGGTGVAVHAHDLRLPRQHAAGAAGRADPVRAALSSRAPCCWVTSPRRRRRSSPSRARSTG